MNANNRKMFPSYANKLKSTDSRQEIDIFPSEAMKDAPAESRI